MVGAPKIIVFFTIIAVLIILALQCPTDAGIWLKPSVEQPKRAARNIYFLKAEKQKKSLINHLNNT